MHPNEHCNCRYADVGCDKMEQVMDQISGKWKMRILLWWVRTAPCAMVSCAGCWTV